MTTPRAAVPPSIAVFALAATLVCAACGGGPSRDAGWEAEPGSEDLGWLLATWSAPEGPRFLVGGVSGEGRVVTDVGGSLSVMAGVPDVPLLRGVHGFSATDVFAVGDAGTVLRFDGDAWSILATPTTAPLAGVWGASPDDVWAVGGLSTPGATAALLHYDGEAWASVALPQRDGPDVTALFGVWGSAADDVYAVGSGGALLHFRGDEWVEEASGTLDDLHAIHGSGADAIVAVGGGEHARVLIRAGDGWTAESLAPVPGLRGVFMRTPHVALRVGGLGAIVRLDLRAGTFREEVPPTVLDFHGISADAAGVLTAVGGDLRDTPGEERGVAFVRSLHDDE